VRYAEVDGQGVVFNAHWLTYFDETCTRYVESWGFGADYWINEFDVMLVKVVVEWSGPARFDEWVEIAVEPTRLGSKSFDLRYRASVDDRAACEATITYVAVKPGSTTRSISRTRSVRCSPRSFPLRPAVSGPRLAPHEVRGTRSVTLGEQRAARFSRSSLLQTIATIADQE
jgi:acyl-CoA thioester hydrolase